MNILAIETTGKYGSLALINEEGIIHSAESKDGNDHLREITSLMDKVLRDAACDKSELTHIAASVGPGSFTGIRIGVTAARTLAQMLGLPCISVSSLKAMALRTADDAKEQKCDALAAIINARRHQVYAGAWQITKSGINPVLEEKQYMIEEFTEDLKSFNKVYFTGDGVDAYDDIIAGSVLSDRYIKAPEKIRYQHASSVSALALISAATGQTLSYDNLLPEYMRLAEAEQRLKEGTLSDKIKIISK